MLDYIVFPFKFIYLCLYSFLYQIVDSYTVALLLLSPVTVAIISFCQKFTRKIEAEELKIQSILKEQIDEISLRYKGKEKNDAIDRLYKRYSYSPVYAIRSAANLFIQLPFLLGAYYMLSDYEQLKYVSFGIITNLYRPDGLIMGVNLLPFVMFAVGTINVLLNEKSDASERRKGILINLFFLIVLYPAPSALLIYWTTNNILFLIRNILCKSRKSTSKVLNNSLFQSLIKNRLSEYEKYLFLVLLWPFLHLSCNNIGHYSIVGVVFSSLVYVPFAYLFSRFFCFVVFKYINKKYQFQLLAFSAFLCLIFLTDTVIKYFMLFGIIGFSILLVVSLLLKYRGKFQLIIPFLVILNACELLMGGYSFAKNVYNDNQSALQERKLDSEDAIDLSEIIFDEKPSFYYIHMESLNSPRILRDVYNIEEPEFYDYLEKKGFEVSNDVYSNGRFTQLVLKMMFTMRLWKENDPSGILTTPRQQGILSGNRENILFRIFKNNGYSTSMYFLGETYFFTKNGPYLDYSDVESFCNTNVFQPIFDLKKSFFDLFNEHICFGRAEKDPFKILVNHFALLEKFRDNNPQLVFIHNAITQHSPVDGTYSYKQKFDWVTDGRFDPYEHPNFNYREAVHLSLKQTKKIIELILNRDPDAVIILQGDHGAHRLSGYPWELDYRSFVDFAKKDGESYQTLVDDMFSVFSAIRIPNGRKISGVYSNATLFPKVLAVLNTKLKDKFESLSPMNCSLAPGDKVVVKDGKLIEFSDVSLCNLKE